MRSIGSWSKLRIPTDFAIALAVEGWSPVIIITLIPAAWHLAMASGTVALGGSIKDTKPRSLNPDRGKLMGFVENWNPGGKPFLAGSLWK